jgi:protein arginine kinase activator
MTCDNCGKEEVNFHYTSNINGTITEKHLCAACASQAGIAGFSGFSGLVGRQEAQSDASFEDIFSDLFGMRPSRRMFGGYGMMFPTFVIPAVGLFVPGTAAEPDAGAEPAKPGKPAEIKIEIDDDMRKRREINMLREQMHQAAAAEDFEKAAALRDSIRKLENGALS